MLVYKKGEVIMGAVVKELRGSGIISALVIVCLIDLIGSLK